MTLPLVVGAALVFGAMVYVLRPLFERPHADDERP